MNTQVEPCNAVPSGPLCKCSGTPCGLLQFWVLYNGLHYVIIIMCYHAVATCTFSKCIIHVAIIIICVFHIVCVWSLVLLVWPLAVLWILNMHHVSSSSSDNIDNKILIMIINNHTLLWLYTIFLTRFMILLHHTFFRHLFSLGWVYLMIPWLIVWNRLLKLSYQAILITRKRVLRANSLHEAEYVNSQVLPCNPVLSGWNLCKCSAGTLYELVQFWRLWYELHYVMIVVLP